MTWLTGGGGEPAISEQEKQWHEEAIADMQRRLSLIERIAAMRPRRERTERD